MRISKETAFEDYLNRFSQQDWFDCIAELLPSIHEIDRNATQIWFYFFPLDLARALGEAEDGENLSQKLLLNGKYSLKDQIDTSHTFLYGHRFWPRVKQAAESYAEETTEPDRLDLASHIRTIAERAASDARVDQSLTIGITAVALMTLAQTGLKDFKAASGEVHIDDRHFKKTPEQILRSRAKDDSQGLFGFLRTVNKVWTVTFDENDDSAEFKLINSQDLAWAAAQDERDFKSIDPRRIEGPIPVECRTASCGTCWVGVLGGGEKLMEVSARERTRMQEFGYIDTDDPKPPIRLACVTPCYGAVSIVIPPWNGFFGKYLKERKTDKSKDVAVNR